MVGTVSVGRGAGCDISAGDPMLSRQHAEFVATEQAVLVRDVKSRSGVVVNGVRVAEAQLQPGDDIRIANFQITYLGAHVVGAGTKRSELQSGSGPDDGDDKTRVVLGGRPSTARRSADPRAPVDDDDGTRLLRRSANRPSAAADNGREASQPHLRPPEPQRALHSEESVAPRAHAARTSWRSRVVVQMVVLVIAVFLAAALPLSWWQSRLIEGMALTRAKALVSWLAAEAALGLEGKREMAMVADDVEREAGVVTAIVVAPDGRVLAPPSRATGVFRVIPGIGVAPAEILRLRWAWNGGLLHLARPVAVGGNGHAAVAWVEFRPSTPPEIGSRAVVVVPALFFAIVAAIVVAGMITGRTLRALTLLNQDTELATNGKLDTVADPLGARPVRDLTDTLNYLVARARRAGATGSAAAAVPDDRTGTESAGGGAPRLPAARGASPTRAGGQPRPAASSHATTATLDATAGPMQIVTDASFKVVDIGRDAADLFELRRGQVLGLHLVDAVTVPTVLDAILKCLAELHGQGERTLTVTWRGLPDGLQIHVDKTGRSHPLVVAFSVKHESPIT